MHDQSIHLAKKLIQEPSISPHDGNCQKIIGAILKKIGFTVQTKIMQNTTNTLASFGNQAPCLGLAGHTDVVPTGPIESWQHPPFSAFMDDNYLWGRGTTDMKVALACMITASQYFIEQNQNFQGRIVFIITSDEEASGHHGTSKLLEEFKDKIGSLDACIVGEPTSNQTLGDTIKIGRRGSINGSIRIHGKQGHIAYPEFADNPIFRLASFVNRIKTVSWDQEDTAPFPNTQFQFSACLADGQATNVIPNSADLNFNIRYPQQTSPESLLTKLQNLLSDLKIDSTITKWNITTGGPYLSQESQLFAATKQAIQEITNIQAISSTDGGTSDGRHLAKICPEVIEFGARRHLAHQLNERIRISEIHQLVDIYFNAMKNYFKV